MFDGPVKVQDGASDLEPHGRITPIVLLMEMFRELGWYCWLVSKCVISLPRSLTHKYKYICIYLYICINIYSSLNALLKFIYVTGWLDPKSCVYIFINKNVPWSLLPFSLWFLNSSLVCWLYNCPELILKAHGYSLPKYPLCFTVSSHYPCI